MRKAILGIVPASLILVQLACNLPQGNQSPQGGPPPPPAPAPTLEIPAEPPSPTATVPTNTPEATPTPQEPQVLIDTLCWQGPGQGYVVVSALKRGERVKLIGVGSIPGWYILENPTYHDPCWIQASDLQIDPGTDLAGLKVYSPPQKKPTKTPKPTSTP